MATIKTQGGKIVLKDGKPSCTCCDDDGDGGGGDNGGGVIVTLPCAGITTCGPRLGVNEAAGEIQPATAAAIYAGGTYTMQLQASVQASFNSFGSPGGFYECDINETVSHTFNGSGCSFGAQFSSYVAVAGTAGGNNIDGEIFASIGGTIRVFDSPQRFCLLLSHSALARAGNNAFNFQATDQFFGAGITNGSSGSGFGVTHTRDINQIFESNLLPVFDDQATVAFSVTVSLASSPP